MFRAIAIALSLLVAVPAFAGSMGHDVKIIRVNPGNATVQTKQVGRDIRNHSINQVPVRRAEPKRIENSRTPSMNQNAVRIIGR